MNSELYGKTDIKSMTKPELTDYIIKMGHPKFRAGQIYDWIHKKTVTGFSEMTNVPAGMRDVLEEKTVLPAFTVLARLKSEKGDTEKFLFGLGDGNAIESVLMRYKHGNSVCISSQVGCRMGCKFCASTLGGLVRNLNASEMLEQVYAIQRISGERVSNVVVMGSGEPMDNFDNFVRFFTLLTNQDGQNISGRNITVSTCGLVPEIRKLAELDLSLTLAVSLHASDDTERKKIMPVANKYSIAEILDACREYFSKTGRRVSFEYSLIAGENDSAESAKKLALLLKGMGAHVNLIPVNPVKERDFKRSNVTNILNFQEILEKNGINATIRREMGADIDAACGQLRRSYILGKEKREE